MPICARLTSMLPAFVGLAAVTPFAAGQISLVTQERSVHTMVSVTSGADDEDFSEAANAGPFVSTVHSAVTGAAGAGADATAGQNSASSATQIWGTLSAFSDVRTGATFVVGEGDGASSVLYIFNLSEPTAVSFTASGSLVYVGSNPDGEPSDLYGRSFVRLLNGVTEEVIAGFQLFPDAGADNANFSGTLPAGQYVILARAETHGYSADLLGPPARTGTATANTTFSLSVTGGSCGSADYNCDGDFGTDADIEAFFACLGGTCPSLPCTSSADFNGDGDVGTDADIEAFFRVLAGGSC